MKFDNTRIRQLRSAMLVQPSVCVERAKLITGILPTDRGRTRPHPPGQGLCPSAAAYDSAHLPPGAHCGPAHLQGQGGSISPELQCDWILKELDILSTRQTDPL